MEWAIEVCKETGLPVAASMCIGPEGDLHGVSNAECAVRMAKAGANVGEYTLQMHMVNLWSDYPTGRLILVCTKSIGFFL